MLDALDYMIGLIHDGLSVEDAARYTCSADHYGFDGDSEQLLCAYYAVAA